MAHMRRQQHHIAFAQLDALHATIDPQVQISVATKLIEKLLAWVVVTVGPVIRATNNRDDEIAVFPDLLIAHRWLQQMRVLVDPASKIERRQECGHGSDSR